MDDIRASLHASGDSGPSLSGFLNFLSEGAFGARPEQLSSGGLPPADGKASNALLPSLYRWWLATPWVRALDSGLHGRPGYVPTAAERGSQQRLETVADLVNLTDGQRARVGQLQTLLVCTETTVVRIARRFPGVLDMEPASVLQRLLTLKSALPGCDVLLMVETVPHLLLGGEEATTAAQVEAASRVLREGLAGAEVERVMEADPGILFEDPKSLAVGVEQLHDLWDVDEAALQASEPFHLALAVKALSSSGPPASF